MSALRRILKVKGGYEVTVKCTGTPMQTRVFGSYQECGKFADDYFLDYLGVQLKSVHHPEGDGVEPESLNADSLETIEIEIPMTPEQILRNLDNGYIMTRQQQAEAAQYIRQLQQEVESLSVTKFHLESDLEKTQDLLNECLVTEAFRQRYLRELRALKPVAYMDSRGVLFNNTTHPHLNTPLYALDEVTK